MPQERPLPGPFNPGDTYPGAGDLNKIVNAIAAMMTGTGGVDVKLYGNRIVIDGKQQQQPIVPGFSNYMQQLVVVEELDDCLRCLPFVQPNNGTINISQVYTSPPGDSNYIYVAKPYYLQRTPWDGRSFTQYGVTYTITFTGLGVRTLNPGSITQNILPAYLPGDLIVAGAAVTGQYIPEESQPISWMDLNPAGRTWQSVGGPAFSGAFVEAGVQVMTQNVATDIAFTAAELFDTENYFDPTTPTIFTIPKDGFYLCGFSVAWQQPSSNGYAAVNLTIPDEVGAFDYLASGALQSGVTAGRLILSASSLFQMSKGQTFGCQGLFIAASVPLNIIEADMWVYQLGS